MTVSKSVLYLVLQIIIYAVVFLSFLPYTTAITANVWSEIEGEGFHRNLKYYIDTGDFKNKSCHIAIFVQLPPSLYVNVDELADLRRLQKSSSCSDGEIDVELFTEKADYQDVTICARLSNTKTVLSVPIHQRYHFATATGKAHNITLLRPKLLIGCKNRLKEHRVSKFKLCWPCIEYSKKWRDVYFKWEGDGNFVWQIPVGNKSRKFEVTCITLFVTLSGAVYVLWTICNTFKVPRERKPKDN